MQISAPVISPVPASQALNTSNKLFEVFTEFSAARELLPAPAGVAHVRAGVTALAQGAQLFQQYGAPEPFMSDLREALHGAREVLRSVKIDPSAHLANNLQILMYSAAVADDVASRIGSAWD